MNIIKKAFTVILSSIFVGESIGQNVVNCDDFGFHGEASLNKYNILFLAALHDFEIPLNNCVDRMYSFFKDKVDEVLVHTEGTQYGEVDKFCRDFKPYKCVGWDYSEGANSVLDTITVTATGESLSDVHFKAVCFRSLVAQIKEESQDAIDSGRDRDDVYVSTDALLENHKQKSIRAISKKKKGKKRKKISVDERKRHKCIIAAIDTIQELRNSGMDYPKIFEYEPIKRQDLDFDDSKRADNLRMFKLRGESLNRAVIDAKQHPERVDIFRFGRHHLLDVYRHMEEGEVSALEHKGK